jgi:truncated hemoglobin YjbI
MAAIVDDASAVTERQIAVLIERFYGRARRDPLLSPVFDNAITDWDENFQILQDFLILGVGRGEVG